MKNFMVILFISISLYVNAQTQHEMNMEVKESFVKSDSTLNAIYKQIFKEYAEDTIFLNKLRISQRLWVKFLDAEIEARYPQNPKRLWYGSMFPMCYWGMKKNMTEARIKQLRVWIDGLPETEGCVGSVKY